MENSDRAKILSPFGRRDLAKISPQELLLAARYWAANTVSMSRVDPWRGHIFCMVFAAVISPTAPDLALWLQHAHAAVSGASLTTSVYQQGYLELISQHRPWYAESGEAVPGMPTIAEHRKSWSVELRINEMARLLEEIKADGCLVVAPRGDISL